MSLDAARHTRGESVFTDDLAEPADLLHGALFTSPVARGFLHGLDTRAASEAPGVVRIFTAEDVPGENQIGAIVPDEPLFAENRVHHVGQPIALVVATSPEAARHARGLVVANIEEQDPILCPREAERRGELIVPSRSLALGSDEAFQSAFAESHTQVEGSSQSGGQEHLYIETQSAMALPLEGGRMRIYAGTQGPTAVQRVAARVLGLAMSEIEVEVQRLGGAFGGKEDQATPWATFAALAARSLSRAVKVNLQRDEDMVCTGKRHPYEADWRLGLDAEGHILAWKLTLYQNAGAAADLSPAILERSLFHACGSYRVPTARITAHSCRTNLTPFTAFRGFGGPQGMFAMESAMARAAEVMGIEREVLQERNLLEQGDVLPYGMQLKECSARRCFSEAAERFDLAGARARVRAHNSKDPLSKRGLAVMPISFGISFTNKRMNQAGALVHAYSDGSVRVATGAVEMGQGVNSKLQYIAAQTLRCDPERVSIAATSTTLVANTSPTAASSGADLNGKAVQIACKSLRERLDGVSMELAWDDVVSLALESRVSLTAGAHYKTPGLEYDAQAEWGTPFAYHVQGSAISEATVDCLRGTYSIDSVRIVHDGGRSLAPLIDTGQVIGALAQGIGWLTLEELRYDERGRLMTDKLATYKAPDIHSMAREVEVVFLEDSSNPHAVLGSKGIGEPPLMYGLAAFFSIREAARAFRSDRGQDSPDLLEAPLTPERLLRFLYCS